VTELYEQNRVLVIDTEVPFCARNNHFEQKSLKILENQIDLGVKNWLRFQSFWEIRVMSATERTLYAKVRLFKLATVSRFVTP